MESVTLIGIDFGKHGFRVRGRGRQGKAPLRKKFSRKQPIEFLANFRSCTIAIEACTGAHFMARLMRVLERLHAQFNYLDEQIADIERELTRQVTAEDLRQRPMTQPGIGPITVSVAAEMGDGKHYR